jgi:branched-chain amino acid aminotransferase
VPKTIFIDGTLALVQLDRNWIPEKDNSALYIRPGAVCHRRDALGVKPLRIVPLRDRDLPERAVFLGSVDLIAEDVYCARVPGGTGAAKCGGNYAGSMIASLEAQKKASTTCSGSTPSSAVTSKKRGLMNVAFVIDGTVVTPPLSGTILPGITRDSVLTCCAK